MWKKVASPGASDLVLLQSSSPEDALFDCYGDSRIGLKREINQDRFFVTSFTLETFPEPQESQDFAPRVRKTGYLFGVADGIGGAPAGERASLLVVRTLKAFIQEEGSGLLREGRRGGEIIETLRRGLRRCQTTLSEDVRHHPQFLGMGTTLTAAVVLWPRLFLFHMGDSRAYLLRGGLLRRLTQDQTYARSLVDAGVLDRKGAGHSHWRHIVWNILGGRNVGRETEVHPDVSVEDLQGGDLLALCTDGLTNRLSDGALRGLLAKEGSAKDLCIGLSDAGRALKTGDDATVIVARFADSKP